MNRKYRSKVGFRHPRFFWASLLTITGASLGMFGFASQSSTLGTASEASVAAGPTPGFHAPVAMPGSNAGTEPSLAIPLQLRAGLRFVTWQNPGEIATSLDGVNFTNRGTRTGGGDVTNAADPSGTLFFGQFCSGAFDLHACLERSPDGGVTWPLHTDIADMHPGAADRPWIETYPHKAATLAAAQSWNPDTTRVYLEYHTFSPEELAYVTVSTDGGHTFSEAKLITSNTNALIASGCNTVPGGVVVDQNNGTVYALWLSGNDVTSSTATGCNYSQIGPFNKAWVSKSTDGGNTWTATLAWQGAFDMVTKVGDNADKIFATLAVDQAGQVHVILPVRHNDDPLGFATNCQVDPNCVEAPNDTDLVMVTSPDAGAHWTLPASIENNSGSYFFPWAAAGSQGVVNVIYYKSATRQPNRPDNIWFVGTTRVTGAVATYSSGANASYTSPPQFAETLLDSGPVHGNGTTGGGICTFGLFCSAVPGANRTLADSLALTFDPAGGVNAVWTDAIGNPNDAKEIHFTCQNSGPSSIANAPNLNGCYGPTDMAISKIGSPESVAPGGTINYHLTVTNHGAPAMPATTSGVTVTDNLPPGSSFVSATPSQGSCAGTGPVVCDLGIFPNGATATIDIAITAPSTPVTLTNTATVTALTDDPNTANNTATAVTTVTPLTLSGVVSRKNHGSGTFDLPLPQSGPPGVECRSGGSQGNHTIVFKFPTAVSAVTGASASATTVSGTQPVTVLNTSDIGSDNREYIVNLSGVPNASHVTVTLTGVTVGATTGNISGRMNVLLADVNGSGKVDSGDVLLVQKQNGQALPPNGSADFHRDLNTNGTIDSGDVFLAQKNNPSQVPP